MIKRFSAVVEVDVERLKMVNGCSDLNAVEAELGWTVESGILVKLGKVIK